MRTRRYHLKSPAQWKPGNKPHWTGGKPPEKREEEEGKPDPSGGSDAECPRGGNPSHWNLSMEEEDPKGEDEQSTPGCYAANNPDEVEFDYDEMGESEMDAWRREGETYGPYQMNWEEKGG